MKWRPLSVLRVIHAWVGAALAVLILLVSITGAALVWKEHYLWWQFPQARESFNPTPTNLAPIAEAVEQHFPGDNVIRIEFARENFALTKVVLRDGHAYLDSRGHIIGHWLHNQRPEDWLYDLHHRLLLGNTGLLMVGLAGLVSIPLILAGAVLFWPVRSKFGAGPLPRGNNPGQWRLAHHNLGVITALPLLLALITGALLVFPDQANSLLVQPWHDDRVDTDSDQVLDDISGTHSATWLAVMERAQRSFPEGTLRTARVPDTLSPYRIVGLQQPGEIGFSGNNLVYIHAGDGHMDVRIDIASLPRPERLLNTAHPLHSGEWNNFWLKLLWSLSGVLAALVCLFGLIAFLKQQLRHIR